MRTLLCVLLCGCSGFSMKPPPPDYTPSLLAGSLILPVAVAVNDRHAYFLEYGSNAQGLSVDGALSRVDKQTGCAQADGGCADLLTNMRFNVVTLTLAPTDVCWLEFYDAMRELWCMDISTARMRRLAQAQANAFALANDGASLYWVNGGATGSLQTTPLSRAAATTLVAGRVLPTSVTTDGSALYWTESGAVWGAGLAGDSPHAIATGLRQPLSLAAQGDYLYFVDTDSVMRVHKNGGDTQTIAGAQVAPLQLAADDAGVYWIAQGTPPNYLDGQVVRADLDGGHQRVVAKDQPVVTGIAADADAVYWIVQGTEGGNYEDGALWRAPKGP